MIRIILISGVSLFIIAVLIWTRPNAHVELKQLPLSYVTVEEVRQRTLQPKTKITGKLKPAHQANLHFQVGGQVSDRLVEVGQSVEEGSVLLRVEDSDFVDTVTELTAQLQTERDAIARDKKLLDLTIKDHELQQRAVQRLEKLSRDSLSSKEKYEQTLQRLYQKEAEKMALTYNVDAMEDRLLILQARLNKAQRNLKRTQLLSPFPGVINAIHVDVGDYITLGQPAIEIVQIDQLDLELEVTGDLATGLRLGQEITIVIGETERVGTVIALTTVPDPTTNTYGLKIRVSAEGLYAGQLVVAEIPGQLYRAATIVPMSAVLYEDGQAYVFELVNDRVHRKPIQIMAYYDTIYIVAGIDMGTTIVSKDVANLADQQTVHVH